MMEDWTDIIGEELENIEEPLPADDWSVLQQKYAAAQRRKKAAAFAWAGGIMSVAAAIALVLFLVRPDTSAVNSDLAQSLIPDVPSPVIPDVSSSVIPDSIGDLNNHIPPQKPVAVVKKLADDELIAENNTEDIPSEYSEEIFDVIRDTTSKTDLLLADASLSADGATKEKAQPTGTFGFADFPEEPQRRVRRPMSIGLSGAVSDSPIIRSYDRGYAEPPMEGEPPYSGDNGLPGVDAPSPGDSLSVNNSQPSKLMMKAKQAYSDSYEHQLPISAGISARFYLTDRLSVNTGLNYTRYKSLRKRTLIATNKSQKDWQYVHYLGVPVRLDWMAVNRKHFNLYLGAGVNMDKCVYATVGEERLYEKQILFGLSGAAGIQVNVIPLVGIYFEPDVSYALNEGSIETFRSDEPFTIAVRAGLRFNF